MIIRFKREGGFTGIGSSKEVNVDDLPEEIKNSLNKLSDFKTAKKSLRRDGYQYTIEITKKNKPTKYVINEEEITEEIAPIITYFDKM